MNMHKILRSILYTVLPAVALAFSSPYAAAAHDVYLVAQQFNKTMPDGRVVVMWGFAEADSTFTTVGTPGVPGPRITVPPAETVLNIHLRNDLAEAVSLVIPGQPVTLAPVKFTDSQGRQRVRSFAAETPAGGTLTYTWSGVKPGTYLYHSGTHPQVQVQMGLYGGLTKDAASGQAYTGVSYDSELFLLFSEIDPAVHDAVANGTYGTPVMPSSLNYRPVYFLVNGTPYSEAQLPKLEGSSGTTLVRMINAGLVDHAPNLLGGAYWLLRAEDGNKYNYTKSQYGLLLTPGKTVDATYAFSGAESYAVYDRLPNIPTYRKGDLNLDTFVDAMDLAILINFLAGNLPEGPQPFSASELAADFNLDTAVDAGDAQALALFLAGL